MMSTQFDRNMSVYLPRCDSRSLPKPRLVESDIAYEERIIQYVSKTFETQKIGLVNRVDVLRKETSDGWIYYSAFVHMEWNDTFKARSFYDMVVDKNAAAKLFHQGKWFWYVNKNSNPLSAKEAEMHKSIYNLERQLFKVTGDLAVAHVLLLKNAAPDNWRALKVFANSCNHPDGPAAAAVQHVRSFIPREFYAPLRMKEEEFLAPLPLQRCSATGIDLMDVSVHQQPDATTREFIDNTQTPTPSPMFDSIIPQVKTLFDAQRNFEKKIETLSEKTMRHLSFSSEDNNIDEPTLQSCSGCCDNKSNQMAHIGPGGCLGDIGNWDEEIVSPNDDIEFHCELL